MKILGLWGLKLGTSLGGARPLQTSREFQFGIVATLGHSGKPEKLAHKEISGGKNDCSQEISDDVFEHAPGPDGKKVRTPFKRVKPSYATDGASVLEKMSEIPREK